MPKAGARIFSRSNVKLLAIVILIVIFAIIIKLMIIRFFGFCRLKDCPRNEQLAKKRSFEGNCEILRTIFQPRALSSAGYTSKPERGLFIL